MEIREGEGEAEGNWELQERRESEGNMVRGGGGSLPPSSPHCCALLTGSAGPKSTASSAPTVPGPAKAVTAELKRGPTPILSTCMSSL